MGVAQDIGTLGQGVIDVFETGMDMAGMVPGIETLVDIGGAGYYSLIKGDYETAGYYAGGLLAVGVGGSTIKNAAKAGKNVYNHSYKYADRVRAIARAVQDPVSHNFPYGFDDVILSTNPIIENNGYKIFQQPGVMNGKKGVFEIGLTKNGIIDHRFFRPY